MQPQMAAALKRWMLEQTRQLMFQAATAAARLDARQKNATTKA
jgi:hypothetical protein